MRREGISLQFFLAFTCKLHLLVVILLRFVSSQLLHTVTHKMSTGYVFRDYFLHRRNCDSDHPWSDSYFLTTKWTRPSQFSRVGVWTCFPHSGRVRSVRAQSQRLLRMGVGRNWYAFRTIHCDCIVFDCSFVQVAQAPRLVQTTLNKSSTNVWCVFSDV